MSDAERCVFLWRLYQQWEVDLVSPIDLTTKNGGELGAQDSVKCEYLFRECFVAGENQTGGTRAGISQIEKVEQRGDIGFESALAAERLSEIEDQLGLLIGELRITGWTESSTATRREV